ERGDRASREARWRLSGDRFLRDPLCDRLNHATQLGLVGVYGSSWNSSCAQIAAVISTRGWAVYDVADASILWAFCRVVDTLSEHCLRPRLSQLCSGCVPGCQHLLGLLVGGVCTGTPGSSGGDHGAGQLGEHVLEGGLSLGCVPGLVVAAGGEGVPGVAVPGVPGDDEGGHDQGERDGALDGAAGAVAGLAGAGDVAGVGEGLLDGPPGGVAFDQGGGRGGQVGGDQGQDAGVVAGEDDLDGAGVQAAVPQAGAGGQVGAVAAAVDPHGHRRPGGGGGQLGGGGQPQALEAGPAPFAGQPRRGQGGQGRV